MCVHVHIIALPVMDFKLVYLISWLQDLSTAIDEEDVAKFTDALKEFDSMTPLVSFLS